MSRGPKLAVALLVIVPLAIAMWILSSMTFGEQISQSGDFTIGFAVALLVVATSVSLMLLRTKPKLWLGLTLIVSGAVCILMSVVLQFYLAIVGAELDRRAAEILAENADRSSFQVNLHRSEPPKSVIAIGYFALFSGIWLAATGIRIGVGSSPVEDDPMFDLPPSSKDAGSGKAGV